ncbi:MAG: hypothetical protein K8S87_06875 [Planctomycetes bacterium]|nr:hypothetical protein [Planctomycetota bacterium]
MYYLYFATGLLLLISFIKSRKKTIKAFKISIKKFIKILPAFVIMIILVSIAFFLLPSSLFMNHFNNKVQLIDVFIATILGSITLMPGFIAYPMCGILLQKGVSYMVISAFTTTLMMVGILTFPVEKEYFGIRVALIRNIIGLIIALVIAITIGFIYGEIL